MQENTHTPSSIIYEQPLNERIRTFMRIEELYDRLEFCKDKDTSIDSHFATVTLLEIISLASRGDLKRELMKEVKRQIVTLEHLSHIPSVDKNKLNTVIKEQEHLLSELDTYRGQLWAHLKDNDFINSIKQRASIPGGTCDFDLPAYHHWLTQPSRLRRETLESWLQPFEIIYQATSKCLQLVRESTQEISEKATRGFYQRNLDPSQPNQLIRVIIDEKQACFPEISAGKHRFSIRFMSQKDVNQSPKQIMTDMSFKLAVCTF